MVLTFLVSSFLVWAFTLALPSLIGSNEAGLVLLANGLGGLPFLKPYELFGLSEANPIVHAAFWSLLFNTTAFVFVSLSQILNCSIFDSISDLLLFSKKGNRFGDRSGVGFTT